MRGRPFHLQGIQPYIHTYIHTYTNVCMYVWVHTYIDTYIHPYKCLSYIRIIITRLHTYIHTYRQPYIVCLPYICIITRLHTYIYIHTNRLELVNWTMEDSVSVMRIVAIPGWETTSNLIIPTLCMYVCMSIWFSFSGGVCRHRIHAVSAGEQCCHSSLTYYHFMNFPVFSGYRSLWAVCQSGTLPYIHTHIATK